jgi:hypothetical protein
MTSPFDRVRTIGLALPGVEEKTSYGTRSLHIRKKLLVRIKEDGETLVLRCPLDEKEFLMEAAPAIFFETDHYKGWPAVLIRLRRIEDAQLKQLVEDAWRREAPKKMVETYDTSRPRKRRR